MTGPMVYIETELSTGRPARCWASQYAAVVEANGVFTVAVRWGRLHQVDLKALTDIAATLVTAVQAR
jgi:hypothetical protein